MNKVAKIFPPEKPVNAKVVVPGSKSITNRALIIAALADGVSTLYGASDADDSLIMIKLLRQLGIGIQTKADTIKVRGKGGKLDSPKGNLYTAEAGTVMRFLTALSGLIPGKVNLCGSPRMHLRPVEGLVNTMNQLGGRITYVNRKGFPPLNIHGGNMKGGKALVDSSVSSQFLSALLMIAPLLPGDSEFVCTKKTASEPYVGLTRSVMEKFGIKTEFDGSRRYFVKGNSRYKPAAFHIEGDASSASYLFAVAALTGGSVEVTNLSTRSAQGDIGLVSLLREMGCSIAAGRTIKVSGPKRLKAIKANLRGMPDVAQTLAVVAAFAEGTSHLSGLNTLQYKETDRLAALIKELQRMGIWCSATKSDIFIRGDNPKGTIIHTYSDHRMAMAFAVAGTRISGLRVQEPLIVNKSFPLFWNTLRKMGIKIEMNI